MIIEFNGRKRTRFCLWLQVDSLEISMMCLDVLSETRFTLKSFMATLNQAIKFGWYTVYSLLRGHTMQEGNKQPKSQIMEKSRRSVSLSRHVIHVSHTCALPSCIPHSHSCRPKRITPPSASKRQQESKSEPKLKPQPQPRHVTRAKNATQHPRVEAEKALWVHRDPEVIQREKDVKKRKKEEKERA